MSSDSTVDPYRGLGGRYVMRDGKRVPATEPVTAAADVATPAVADAPPIADTSNPQVLTAADTAVNQKRSRKGR